DLDQEEGEVADQYGSGEQHGDGRERVLGTDAQHVPPTVGEHTQQQAPREHGREQTQGVRERTDDEHREEFDRGDQQVDRFGDPRGEDLVPDVSPPTLLAHTDEDRKSTRLNSSHVSISYAVFCLKKKKYKNIRYSMSNNTVLRLS